MAAIVITRTVNNYTPLAKESPQRIEAVGESSDVNTWVIEVYVGRTIPLTLV